MSNGPLMDNMDPTVVQSIRRDFAYGDDPAYKGDYATQLVEQRANQEMGTQSRNLFSTLMREQPTDFKRDIWAMWGSQQDAAAKQRQIELANQLRVSNYQNAFDAVQQAGKEQEQKIKVKKKSGASQILGPAMGTAGAVVGGIYGGGPMGAAAGYQIGSGVGGMAGEVV